MHHPQMLKQRIYIVIVKRNILNELGRRLKRVGNVMVNEMEFHSQRIYSGRSTLTFYLLDMESFAGGVV